MKKVLWAATYTPEELNRDPEEFDLLEDIMQKAMGRIGWECVCDPRSTVQWIGNKLEEQEDGSLNVYVEIDVEDKENPEYDERTGTYQEYEEAEYHAKYQYIG